MPYASPRAVALSSRHPPFLGGPQASRVYLNLGKPHRPFASSRSWSLPPGEHTGGPCLAEPFTFQTVIVPGKSCKSLTTLASESSASGTTKSLPGNREATGGGQRHVSRRFRGGGEGGVGSRKTACSQTRKCCHTISPTSTSLATMNQT